MPPPYSLELLRDCLPDIRVPAEPFDPEGEWEHKYAIWNPARSRSTKSALAGSLRIRKRLTDHGDIRLQVTQVIRMQGANGTGNATADITCDPNDLATPTRWKVDSEVLDAKGTQVPLTAISTSGSLPTLLTRKMSCSWSLFDAVQRLPFDAKELRFDMLEEMELLRPDQILRPGEAAQVRIGGRMMKLRSFEQIGTGILPFTYWLDENHRLIVAVSQRRAYLLDAGTGGAK